MIDVGLLPITSDWKSLEKQSASSFVKGATEDQTADLCEVRRLAMKLPTLSKEMLEEQRAAFQGSGTASNVTEENAVETHCVDTGQSDPQALWVNLESHLIVLQQGLKNLKLLRMLPMHIERASSWLRSSRRFANGSEKLSMSHLTKR